MFTLISEQGKPLHLSFPYREKVQRYIMVILNQSVIVDVADEEQAVLRKVTNCIAR